MVFDIMHPKSQNQALNIMDSSQSKSIEPFRKGLVVYNDRQ